VSVGSEAAYPAPASARRLPALRAAMGAPVVMLAAGMAALLVLQLTLLRSATGPWTTHDEAGFLAAARFFSGADVVPTLEPIPFYHPGYSLLLAPLDALIAAPGDVYRAAVGLNAVLAALQAVPLYALARNLRLEPWRAALAALAVAAYPAFLLDSQTAWAESLFQLLFACFALSAVLLARRPDAGRAALLAGLAGTLYMVHPRAAGIVLLAVGFVAVLVLMRALAPRALAIAAAAAIVPVALTHALKALLLDRIYAPDPAREGMADILAPLGDPGRWDELLVNLAGQSWYLTAATLGLAPIGIALLGVRVVRAVRARRGGLDPEGLAAGLLLLSCLSVLAASSLWIGVNVARVDHLIFGRYDEGIVAVPMLVALVAILRGERLRTLAAAGGAAALILALGAVLQAEYGPETLALPFAAVTVTGILAFLPDRAFDLPAVAWSAAGATLALGVVATLSRRVAVTAVAAFFAVSALAVQDAHIRPYLDPQRDRVDLRHALAAIGPLGPISYDMAGNPHFGTKLANAFQFWLNRSRFTLFDSRLGQRPATELVLAGRRWPAGGAPGARAVFPEATSLLTLWVLPGPTQDAFARRGMLLPEDPAAPLPADAMRAGIAVPGRSALRLAPGAARWVGVRVRHIGAGSPWVPLAALADPPAGAIRVAASWHRLSPGGRPLRRVAAIQRAELPRTVLPGEAVDVRLPLAAAGSGGRPLAPGRYAVDVDLYQAGVRSFGTGITPDLTVEVR
jgi:hypothetical protein